jgi:hypothetical protein
MDITTRRRRALSTALALLLAIESVSAVAAAAQVNVAQRDEADAPLAAVPTASPVGAVLTVPAGTPVVRGPGLPDYALADRTTAADSAAGTATRQPAKAPRLAIPEVRPPAASTSGSSSRSKAFPTSFKGRNHVWIPSLGINRSVSWFSCDRTRPPDNYVYRWGCAGRNNVYLLGHAYSVFKPLHDAYYNHRLKVGMKAYYADAKGKVHAYAVKWWRVTLPTPDASWAWAALSKPSMTLQTCVGANSSHRLMVRLVEVGS